MCTAVSFQADYFFAQSHAQRAVPNKPFHFLKFAERCTRVSIDTRRSVHHMVNMQGLSDRRRSLALKALGLGRAEALSPAPAQPASPPSRSATWAVGLTQNETAETIDG